MKSFVRNHPVISFFVFALLGALAVNYSILYDYAYSDAYESIWTGNISDGYLNAFLVGGRPFYGLASVWIFKDLIHEIADLKWLRLFSLLASVVFATQFFSYVLRHKVFKRGEGMVLSFLILCVPSFTVFMGWSIIYEVPVGMNLSFLGGALLATKGKHFKEWVWRFPVAVILVISALCFYQSSATAFLIPFALISLRDKDFGWGVAIRSGILLLLSFGLYYLLFKYILDVFELTGTQRSNVDFSNLPKRFLGFYTRELKPLVHGSGVIFMFKFFERTGIVIFALFVLRMGYSIYQKKASLLGFLFIILILPLSYLSNLLSVDTWISARTLGPPAVLVLTLQFWLVQQFAQKHILLKGAALSLALAFVVVAGVNQNKGLAGLQAQEYKVLRTEIESMLQEEPDSIVVLRPAYGFATEVGYMPRYYLDEIGLVSSTRNWVSIPMINQILREESGIVELKKSINHPILSNHIPIATFEKTDSTYTSIEGRVIDMDQILREYFEKK